MRFIRNELISLKDMGFLRGKFDEEVNWKTLALNNITLLKDKIKVINIQSTLYKCTPWEPGIRVHLQGVCIYRKI